MSLPIMGLIWIAEASRSQSLTQERTRSPEPRVLGSSVAWTFSTWVVPRSPSINRPLARMAARCAPRAIKMTSCPDVAGDAPSGPPTPPAPMTAIRIEISLSPTCRHNGPTCHVRPLVSQWVMIAARVTDPPALRVYGTLDAYTGSPISNVDGDRVATDCSRWKPACANSAVNSDNFLSRPPVITSMSYHSG